MQRDLSDRNAVCPSVCPSVTRVYCEKMNESSADILTPYEREFHLVFWHEEWLVGNVPFYAKFWGQADPVASKRFKNGNFQSIFAAAQPLDLAEKVQLWLWEVAYELSNEPMMNSLRCP